MSRAGLLFPALSGLLLALSLPPDPLLLLAPLWAAPLAFALARLPCGAGGGSDAFLAGAVCGGVHGVLLLHWAPGAATPLLGSVAAWGAAAALWGAQAAFTGLATWAAHRAAGRQRGALAPSLALAWILLGWLPALLPGVGFPWLGPEAALVEHPELLGLSRWGGGGAIAGLLVLAGASFGAVAAGQDRRMLVAAAFALLALGGGAALATSPQEGAGGVQDPLRTRGDSLRVALVSIEAGPGRLVDRTGRRELPGELGDAVLRVLDGGEVDLLVWPESLTGPGGAGSPGASPEEASAREIARALGVPVYFGVVEPGAEGGMLRNRFLRVDGGGRPAEVVHEKRRLIPGVEWRPGGGGVGPGAAREPFVIPGGIRAGALICFEALFPGEGARLRRSGARILLLPGNEGWLRGRGGGWRGAARAQFDAVGVLRAVELGVPVLRSTVGGGAGGFGSDGRRLNGAVELDSGRRTSVLVLSVEPGAAAPTIFALGGGTVLHGIALLLLGGALLRRPSGTMDGDTG